MINKANFYQNIPFVDAAEFCYYYYCWDYSGCNSNSTSYYDYHWENENGGYYYDACDYSDDSYE